jgi:hypothetical protein
MNKYLLSIEDVYGNHSNIETVEVKAFTASDAIAIGQIKHRFPQESNALGIHSHRKLIDINYVE